MANILGQITFGLLAMTICLPSMQEWGQLLQASPADVQLTFSAYVVAFGGFQLVYGPLSDRYGRKPVLLVGFSIAALASLLAAWAPTMEWLLLARVLQGVGSAAGGVLGRALAQDHFQGAERTRIMAYIGMAMGLCPPLASLLGGQIHVALGWRANFVLMAMLALVLLLAAWRVLPAAAPAAPDGAQPSHWLRAMGQSYRRLAGEAEFLWFVLLLSTTTACFYTFLGGAPLVFGAYGVGPDRIGLYIMGVPLSYIVGNFLTSHWVHRFGERRIMLWGQIATVIALLLLISLGMLGVQSLALLLLPLMLLGVGHGLLMPSAIAGTVGVVPALAGSAAAVAGLMQQCVGAAGAYVVGLVPHQGVTNMAWIMLGFTLLSVTGHVFLRRLQGRP